VSFFSGAGPAGLSGKYIWDLDELCNNGRNISAKPESGEKSDKIKGLDPYP